MKQPLYKAIAGALDAKERCFEKNNKVFYDRWSKNLKEYEAFLPTGVGFDIGTEINNASNPNKLVLTTSYHHMDDLGYYDGWTEHTIKVIPDLQYDFELKISGKNRNDIKDHIYDVFEQALRQEVEI